MIMYKPNTKVIAIYCMIITMWVSGCGGERPLSMDEQETLQALIAYKLSQTAASAIDNQSAGLDIEAPTNTAAPLRPTETPTHAPSVTLVPTATPSPLPSPTPPGGGGRIAFTSNRGGIPQIYVMNPDGSDQTWLTDHALESKDPNWSPDGQLLLYIAVTGVNQSSLRTIDVVNQQEKAVLDLNAAAESPSLTPDGQIVLAADICVFGCGTDDPTYYSRIMLRNLDGGEMRQLSPGDARFFRPKVSPDGARVIVERDNSVAVYRLSNFTRDPNVVPISFGNSQDGAWSPDGSWIAFASYQDNQYDIFIANLSTGEIVQLTDTPEADRYPSWSPDGKWIAFASKTNNNWDIYVTDLEASQPARLTDDPAVDTKPAWSPVP
jgi:TolB protein